MSELLVLIDHDEGKVRKVSQQILTAAHRLAGDLGATVAGVWLGEGASDAAEVLGRAGAEKVYAWESPDARTYVTLPQVEALEEVWKRAGGDTLLFPSTSFLKDVAARFAVRVGGGIITDVSDLELEDGRLVATKEVFGGETITRSRVRDDLPQIIGVNANAFSAETPGSGPAEIVALDLQPSEEATRSKVLEVVRQAEGGRPDITEASVVVAGGRGLGDAEGFQLIEQLADVFGGAVGASRAASDAGWIPHRHQIGQTGRTIAPSLYIGCGISGAIQHRAGMQTAQTIVVVNKDGEAPLFQIADFGVVGDLYKILPKLVEELTARKGD